MSYSVLRTSSQLTTHTECESTRQPLKTTTCGEREDGVLSCRGPRTRVRARAPGRDAVIWSELNTTDPDVAKTFYPALGD
jgi:hypothetical protein